MNPASIDESSHVVLPVASESVPILGQCCACGDLIEHEPDYVIESETRRRRTRLKEYHSLCFAAQQFTLAVLRFMHRGFARHGHPDYSFVVQLIRCATSAVDRLTAHHEEHLSILAVPDAPPRSGQRAQRTQLITVSEDSPPAAVLLGTAGMSAQLDDGRDEHTPGEFEHTL